VQAPDHVAGRLCGRSGRSGSQQRLDHEVRHHPAERALAGPELTRWIDQLSLVMARHHLDLRGQDVKLAYFDTSSDINNVMYPSYDQDYPFRSLSLFHGFDTSSLENNPRAPGGTAETPRKAAKARKAKAK
jgi:hypothetical protein